MPEGGHTGDVAIGPGGEDEADGGNEAGGESSSAKDDVDQRPSTTTVPIGTSVSFAGRYRTTTPTASSGTNPKAS